MQNTAKQSRNQMHILRFARNDMSSWAKRRICFFSSYATTRNSPLVVQRLPSAGWVALWSSEIAWNWHTYVRMLGWRLGYSLTPR